jgi:hypothetical protein
MSDKQEVKETKEPTLEELTQLKTEQLENVDTSILTAQALIRGGKIKVVDDNELAEGQTEPIALNIFGQEMIQAMLNPTLNKLLKDRGSLSFDLEQLKNQKES